MGIVKSYRKGVPFWGKLCAGLVCASAVMFYAGDCTLHIKAAGASSISELEDKAKEIQQENEERQAEIEGLDDDISSNEHAMDLVNKQIDGVNNEIQICGELITAKQEDIDQKLIDICNVEQTIADKETEIEGKKDEIGKLQEENKKNLERFGKLARYMYMNNASSQIPVLNGSDDWYEYFVYSSVVNNIGNQNYDFMMELKDSITKQEGLIDDLNTEIENLETEKASLQSQKESYETEAANLQSEKESLQNTAQEKKDYLYGLAADNEAMKEKVSALESDIAAAQAEADAINEKIEELIRQAQEAAANSDEDVTQRPDYSGDGLMWPVSTNYTYISTYFGYDPWRNGMHRGIDIGDSGIGGASIYAAASGTVISVSNTCPHNFGKNYRDSCGGGYGNYIIIDHGGGISTLYAHCQAIYVSEGQTVSKGEAIGEVGSTGWSTANHLHFEVREYGVAVNPLNYVSY